MKKLLLVASAAIAMLALPVSALAQADHADSVKTTLIVTQAVAAGPTTLQPGEYKFQCRMLDGKTFLVVTFADSGKEVARVPCVKETLDAKVSASEMRSLTRQDGTRQLTSVRIKGETVSHRVVN